ncbi:MAG: RNA polymerase sigma factor [Aliiglaciecola sp.]|uniref:RNA polymerase sigma factor n=1 Tax=Aliiglaciecola sp. TaxID=1872441 RepID=UPI0032994195
MKKSHAEIASMSNVSRAFWENREFLKNFLKRFLYKAEDIEDVAQEAYMKAYHAEQKNGVERPQAYLFKVAKNIALNELNRKSRQMTDYIEDRIASIPVDGNDSVEDELEAQQSVKLYYEAVASLPKKCRQVFLLRKVNGMSQQEIADHLEISISTVEKHLRNGTKRSRAYIQNCHQSGANGEQRLAQKKSQGRL